MPMKEIRPTPKNIYDRYDGRCAIEYIKNPSEEVKLAAVKQNGCAIKYIENPSEKVQLAAVNQDRTAFHYIKNPTPKVIALANAKSKKKIR